MMSKEHHQKQIMLLPSSFQDFLGDGHEAVIPNEFLQELDTRVLEQ